MSELTIERIEVYAVGPDVLRVRWALDQSEMYQANIIVRLQTREGDQLGNYPRAYEQPRRQQRHWLLPSTRSRGRILALT